MTGILLTQYSGSILGPIAKILGYIMNGIFTFLDSINCPNIGVAIILFTIVIYMLLLPLTIKQQKFSKLSAKMNPEIQAIQAKYKDKKDNDSVMAMNQETQAVYAKYGVSATGSCVQLLIQMPILLALYKVIYSVPAYVPKVKELYYPLVDKLYEKAGIGEFIQGFEGAKYVIKQFSNELFINNDKEYVTNTIIDCLNRASTAEWNSLAEHFPDLAGIIEKAHTTFNSYNIFLGLNIANSPSYTVSTAWADKNILLMIGGILIPIFAALTQWINTKLMPQTSGNNSSDTMAQTMKTMNYTMPIMSAVFCYSLPIGMGLYWIIGAVIRIIQQIIINKHLDKIDIDKLIEKNADKAAKKMEKQKKNMERMSAYANMNTKSIKSLNTISERANITGPSDNHKKMDEEYKKAVSNNAKPGSIAEKVNLVNKYNDKKGK